MPLQYLAIIDESSYGVTQTVTPTTHYIRVTDDTPFSMVPQAQRAWLRSADVRNRRFMNIHSREVVAGNLQTYLWPTQTSFLLDWATNITTGNLVSKTIRHYDGKRTREYLGCKVRNLTLSCSAEQMEGAMRATFTLVAQKPNATDPTFAQPAQSVYPAEQPWKFQETKGGLILDVSGGTTVRTQYNSWQLTIANTIPTPFDEDKWITDATFEGRDVNSTVSIRFQTKTDRDRFEAQSALSYQVTFTKPGTPVYTLVFDLKDQVVIGGLDRALPLAAPAYETVNLEAPVDPVDGSDFSYTYSAV